MDTIFCPPTSGLAGCPQPADLPAGGLRNHRKPKNRGGSPVRADPTRSHRERERWRSLAPYSPQQAALHALQGWRPLSPSL